jgi:hypothetical protein
MVWSSVRDFLAGVFIAATLRFSWRILVLFIGHIRKPRRIPWINYDFCLSFYIVRGLHSTPYYQNVMKRRIMNLWKTHIWQSATVVVVWILIEMSGILTKICGILSVFWYRPYIFPFWTIHFLKVNEKPTNVLIFQCIGTRYSPTCSGTLKCHHQGVKHDPAEIGAQFRGKQRRMGAVQFKKHNGIYFLNWVLFYFGSPRGSEERICSYFGAWNSRPVAI